MRIVVEYQADISDPSKFAASPGITPAVTFKNFGAVTILGDIVASNGQPRVLHRLITRACRESAGILAAVGYPAVDSYQVHFQMHSDTAKGLAAIQLSAAWIADTSVSIPIHWHSAHRTRIG